MAQADCQKQLDFAISEVTTDGCLSPVPGSNPTQYTTSDAIKLNGIPFPAPPSGTQTKVTLPANSSVGGSLSLGATRITLGGISVFSGNLGTWNLPAGGRGDEKEVASFSVPDGVAIKGLAIKGSIAVRLGYATDGTHYATFPLNIELPDVFKTGPEKGSGGASGMAGLRVDNAGVHFDGLKLQVSNVWVGKLKIESVCFSFVPAGGTSATPCEVPSLGGSPFLQCASNNDVDRWDGNAVMELPTASKPTLALFGGLAGGSISKLGGFVDKLGTSLPLAEGVYLTRVGVGVCVTPPPFQLRGDIGVSALPKGGKSALTVNGSVLYTDAHDNLPWQLKLSGDVSVFDTEVGSGALTIRPTGDFDFNLDAKVSIGTASIAGAVSGWLQTQQKKFNVDGNIRGCIGSKCAGAEAAVSSSGIAGCLDLGTVPYAVLVKDSNWTRFKPWRVHWETRHKTLEAGFGKLWGGTLKLFAASCDMGSYQATKSAVAAGSQFHLQVAPGTASLAVAIHGHGGPPNVIVRGPDGTRLVDKSASAKFKRSHYMLVKNSADGSTDLLLMNPAPGTWTIASAGGPHAITGFSIAPFEAPPEFAGSVGPAGHGKQHLSMVYTLQPGDSVSLEESSPHVDKLIADKVQGHACPAPQRPHAGERTLCADLLFTPALGPAGKREVLAVVTRNGMPITRVPVAGFDVGAPPMPARPDHLQLIRQGSNVVVDWSRVAHASDYTVSVQLSDGREFGNTPGPNCRGFLLRGVGPGVGVDVEVAGLRQDLQSGRFAKLTLAGGAGRSGVPGPAPRPICVKDAIR